MHFTTCCARILNAHWNLFPLSVGPHSSGEIASVKLQFLCVQHTRISQATPQALDPFRATLN